MLKIQLFKTVSIDEEWKTQNYFHCHKYLSLSVIAIHFYFVRCTSMNEKKKNKA